jgi:hypothetical protein
MPRANRHHIPGCVWYITHRKWLEALLVKANIRDAKWTENVAVGTESFVRTTKATLGTRAKERKVVGEHGRYRLRQSASTYETNLGGENAAPRPRNQYFWKGTV